MGTLVSAGRVHVALSKSRWHANNACQRRGRGLASSTLGWAERPSHSSDLRGDECQVLGGVPSQRSQRSHHVGPMEGFFFVFYLFFFFWVPDWDLNSLRGLSKAISPEVLLWRSSLCVPVFVSPWCPIPSLRPIKPNSNCCFVFELDLRTQPSLKLPFPSKPFKQQPFCQRRGPPAGTRPHY